VGGAFVAGSGAMFALSGGLDIIETVATTDIAAGQMDYFCVWSPCEPNASVVAA
jgi:hypothetical protein